MKCEECDKTLGYKTVELKYDIVSIKFTDNRNNIREKHYHLACFMDKIKEATSTEINLSQGATLIFDTSDKIDELFNYTILGKQRPGPRMRRFPC